MPSFLRGHVESFRFFGAVPRVVLYDNLKSAVLEREGDAVRFHPTLLALSGHYRFEPRACAPYRPNEKGRVERAIQDVRDNFFAARDFTSVADPNVQAMAWCQEMAPERKVPDQKHKSVVEAFAEDKALMIGLAEDAFAVDECLEVRVGKTPYLRFDKNDYSVPHTHVEQNLSVIASDERVRVVDPEVPDAVIADHPRTFDRDQRVEQEGHVRALVKQKRRAHQSRGFDRLFSVVPTARIMMERLAERGENLGGATSGLLQILDRIGAVRLYGCLARIDEIRGEPWLERVMTIEREERTRRSLVHRTHLAGVGAFKPLCDFDWAWPKGIDRAQVEDLFSLRFIAEGENVILVGPTQRHRQDDDPPQSRAPRAP